MDKMSQLFFSSILSYFNNEQRMKTLKVSKEYNSFYTKHKNDKEENLKKLRPNLSNPKCQDELAELDKKEKDRTADFVKISDEIKTSFKDEHFQNG